MIQPNDLWTMLDAALPLLRENPLCGQEARQLENLRKRLAENQLVLAVFGQFKRGKSTFINQLLGAPCCHRHCARHLGGDPAVL